MRWRNRRLGGALCAAVVASLAATAWGTGGVQSERAGPGPPNDSRVVTARIYQGGKWVLPGQTPKSVGAALARLEPSYVSSLVRFQAGEAVTKEEVADYNTVRAAVLAVEPDAKFSIELNGLEYPSAKKMTAMMAKVRERFDNDGWLFDFYTTAAAKKPKVMQAAVDEAHANGEFLGGNAFGIAQHPKFPADTDYLAVQDTDFKINLNAVRALAKRATVFFHLGNSPEYTNSDGCEFIEDFSSAKRTAYISRRASQQAKYNFTFGYPVFFPECQRNRSTPTPAIFAYQAVEDEPVFTAIGQLLDRYDSATPQSLGNRE